jgi:hypothetical protein
MCRHVPFVLPAERKKEAAFRMHESIDVRFNNAVAVTTSRGRLGESESCIRSDAQFLKARSYKSSATEFQRIYYMYQNL